MNESEKEQTEIKHFIAQKIEADIEAGKNGGQVVTRFPPEPNGYLHIGHAKSICLNYEMAQSYKGKFHLRFDDTNPAKEDMEFVNSIKEDIQWLGCDWGENLFFASDYFEQLYQFAITLIEKKLAYVCELTAEEMRSYRGSLTEPGKNSPYRERSVEENLDLFKKMRAGEFDEGTHSLRAKIDMAAPNINLRDPVLYRVRKVHHQRTGDDWCLYPMYDFTHGLSDMIEGITHSICTLEFEDHRPLYDWFLEVLETEHRPQQIEFSKLKLDYLILGKRHLKRMVDEKLVDGWDDPRMPTLSGMRNRGYTPESIRGFCKMVGVTKKDSTIAMSTFESAVRDDLGPRCPRAMGVLDPIKVILTNWEEGRVQEIEAPFHPQDESFGSRKIPFTKNLYIDRDDFMEDPPKKYFRLRPDGMVRLRYGYVIHCQEVVKDESGKVIELKCEYLPDTFAGQTPEGMKKVKGIIHWVSADQAIETEVHLYDRLFLEPKPGKGKEDFVEDLNPDSLKIIKAMLEPSLKDSKLGDRYQFERLGYFYRPTKGDEFKFHRIITLRDTWSKIDKEKGSIA